MLSVVPARGGSKGIVKKNLAELNGRPLIVHTLAAAQAARYAGRIVVSTDDAEVADVAAGDGIEVVERPASISGDEASTELALLHVLDVVAAEGYNPDVVVTLEPTSPLRSPETIDRCVAMFERDDVDAVVSVVETSALVGTVSGGGLFEHLIPGQPRRRQDRASLYTECGVIYATRSRVLQETGSVLGRRAHAVIVDPFEAVDINEPSDLVIAEVLMRVRSGEQRRGD